MSFDLVSYVPKSISMRQSEEAFTRLPPAAILDEYRRHLNDGPGLKYKVYAGTGHLQ